MAKNYHPVSLFSQVGKIFEKRRFVAKDRFVDHLEKCRHFSDSQNGFRSYRSIADLPRVVSDRIAMVFIMYGATQAVVLAVSLTFNSVPYWSSRKLKSSIISGQILSHIPSFLFERQLQVFLGGVDKFPVNNGAPQHLEG